MFCPKCGNKLEENIAFCPRCGARQPVADAAEQPIDNAAILDGKKADETVLPIETATKAYELLRENVALCPEVKSFVLEEYHSAAVVVGKINKYSVRVLNGQIGLGSSPVFPFVIPMVLCILSMVFFMVATYMNVYYGDAAFLGLYGEDLILPASILMLLSGLSGIGVSVFGNKEKKIILPFIRKVLGQPKYIEQFPHIEMVAYSFFVFSGIGYLVFFGLLQ